MSERAPYSRIYWTVRSDPRLAAIYGNDANFAAWTRLLIAADMAWPAPADIPASTKRAALTALEQAGVVELLPGGLFRFHGLDAERGRRRSAAGGHAVPEPDPLGDHLGTTRSPSREEEEEETRREEPSRDARDPADTYWSLSGRYPTDRTLAWIDDLTGQYGADAVIAAMGTAHRTGSAQGLLGRVSDELKRNARKLDLKARAAEAQRITENRRASAASQLTISRHNAGQHEAAPDETCPACRLRGAA